MNGELFVPNGGHAGKVRCTVCGRTGYPGGSWQDACVAGHPYVCTCGRAFATRQGFSGHLRQMDKAALKSRQSGMDWPPVSLHVRTEPDAGSTRDVG